jgi:hypothetical protein
MGTTPGPDWGFFLPTPRSLVVRAGAGYFAGNQIGGHARIQATGPCLLAPTRALGPPRPTGRREVYAWASVPYSAPGGRL